MNDDVSTQFRHVLESLGKEHGLEILVGELKNARMAFFDAVAQRIAPSLNQHLASAPQETLEEKQALAKKTNALLRELGLAIRDKTTHDVVYLQADPGHDPVRGRFQLRRSDDAPNFRRTRSAVDLSTLLPLDLVASPDRHPRPWGRGR